MHAIDALYQEHLARRQIPSRDLLERHTRRITNERLAGTIAGRFACALPSAEALDYLRRHLRAPLLTVAAGIGFWAHCLHQVQGIESLATDLFAPEDKSPVPAAELVPGAANGRAGGAAPLPGPRHAGDLPTAKSESATSVRGCSPSHLPTTFRSRIFLSQRLRRRAARNHVRDAGLKFQAGGLHCPLGPGGAGPPNANPRLAHVKWTSAEPPRTSAS